MNFNGSRFSKTATSTAMILGGVITKNSLEQLDMKNHWGNILGGLLFITGWGYTGYNIANKEERFSYIPLVVATAIAFSAMAMKKFMTDSENEMPMVLPLVFAVSWLTLGYYISDHLEGYGKYSGFISSIMVLMSMMSMLPNQRDACVVDGPGMPFFTIGLYTIALLDSLN
jgi:putative Mn2+ efflux pump MntP